MGAVKSTLSRWRGEQAPVRSMSGGLSQARYLWWCMWEDPAAEAEATGGSAEGDQVAMLTQDCDRMNKRLSKVADSVIHLDTKVDSMMRNLQTVVDHLGCTSPKGVGRPFLISPEL